MSRLRDGDAGGPPSASYILKIASRCNLNCTYCYIYNKGDTSHRTRPRVMSPDVARAALRRIVEYAVRHGLREAVVALHGGEPLLVGKAWMARFLDDVAELTAEHAGAVRLWPTVQTNGTLLDAEWIALFARHGVQIGVSLDGPAAWNDLRRPDHAGRGSHRRVREAIGLLAAGGDASPPWGVLVVADPRIPGPVVFRHLLRLGVRKMDFLWPDHHYRDLPPWEPGALGTYYADLFDAWYAHADPDVRIRWFESVVQLVLGGASGIDSLGAHPVTDVVIETDGTLEPLDALRSCGDGMTRTSLGVARHTVEDLRGTALYRLGLRNQELLPDDCRACPVYEICGGGYMPHRWSPERRFANPSVHCADLRHAIGHIAGTVREGLAPLGPAPPGGPGGFGGSGGPHRKSRKEEEACR
ncbi:radical SAM protein [Streptomyces sp. URMC 126]|uniref:radical SAM protein n=1 Tax=Streptomyces sp. URMC 126 TaxID=3423401 RepID=UPI003F1AEB40